MRSSNVHIADRRRLATAYADETAAAQRMTGRLVLFTKDTRDALYADLAGT